MVSIPTNEAEAEALHKRILAGAEYLEHPFIKPEKYNELIKIYDELQAAYMAYRQQKEGAA